MAARPRNSTTALLLGAVAALLALNWKVSVMDVDTSPLVDEVAAIPMTAQPPPTDARPTLRPLADYGETLARPLFHPSRRPLVAKPPEIPAEVAKDEAPAEVAAGESSRLKLVGLMRTGGRAQRALLRLEGQPYGTWVDVGGEIEGWTLSSIDVNTVLIEKNGGREKLQLHAPTP